MYTAIAVVAIAMFPSCFNPKNDIKTTVYSHQDTTINSKVTVSIELPASHQGVSGEITHVLHQAIDEHLSRVTAFEGQRFFQPFPGDLTDNDAFVQYYFDEVVNLISGQADQEIGDRKKIIMEDDSLTMKEKWDRLLDSYIIGWEYEYNLSKIEEAPRYVVFYSQDYIYMGGAHGGVCGDGALTFSKSDGHLVECFIDPKYVHEMQSLIMDGLTGFYDECGEKIKKEDILEYKFIETDDIPLPSWQPYPTKDGLVFTYQQYEILPYAMGMPSFTIPYEKVKGFMTDDARRTLGI